MAGIVTSSSNAAAENLADELALRWHPFFAPKTWPERLELLHQVHEQLKEDLGDLTMYSAVSPRFIRKLIERLSAPSIESIEQAHIYANSDDAGHRRAAGEWLNQSRRHGAGGTA